MSFRLTSKEYKICSSVEEMKRNRPTSVEFMVDSYSWETASDNTILLTFANEEAKRIGEFKIANTIGNRISVVRLMEELWGHDDKSHLYVSTFLDGENMYTEIHFEFINIVLGRSLSVVCTRGSIRVEKQKKQESRIQLDIHKCIQDVIFDTETYLLKSPADMWARLDNDKTLGVLTAKPSECANGARDICIVIGPIEPSGKFTNDLNCEICNKLKPFLNVFRDIDVEHEHAKLIAKEVYSSRTAYEENEMSCLRLELYIEDEESNVGKTEKLEIFI